jgi:hypothetical protein
MSGEARGLMREEGGTLPSVRCFSPYEVHDALTYALTGNIALHFFRYDLRRLGLGKDDPACHILSNGPSTLADFMHDLGIPPRPLHPPRPNRPAIWHADAFGWVLGVILRLYPPSISA